MMTEEQKQEKEELVSELNEIIAEKKYAYLRIESIIKREAVINSRLGDIYQTTRDDKFRRV